MFFLDEAVITARSGDGGKGCVSFRREKFVPKGGPDGGDGGRGGNVIAEATRRACTLTEYNYRKNFRAQDGQPGKGGSQTGRDGSDILLEVPLGTVVEDLDTGEILADLVQDRQNVLVIPGGKGGKGNEHFATSTNRAPRFAQPGRPGKEKKLRLCLKSLADIGLVGLPNVGKSTLLSRLTKAHPKINSYPFTTLVPNMGIMPLGEERSLIIADIPGLIEGASLGRGLGLRFLRHVERTRFLLEVLDITFRVGDHILSDFHILRNEIKKYDRGVAQKPHFVVINKMDLYQPETRNLAELQYALNRLGVESFPISALTGQGLQELRVRVAENFDTNPIG